MNAKQLTNMRASGKDEAVRLTPPRVMSLAQALAYLADDELVEVTPKSVRLRKRLLDPPARTHASRLTDAGRRGRRKAGGAANSAASQLHAGPHRLRRTPPPPPL